MAGRAAAALLAIGDSSTVALVTQLADGLGIPLAERGRRSRLPVVALVGATTVSDAEVRAGPPSPASVFAEPPSASWFEEVPGGAPAGAALYAAWSPAVALAGREIAAAGPLRHVDVRVRQPRGTGFPAALALAAWTLAGQDVGALVALARGRARLTGSAVVAEVDGTASPLPEWSLQAASDHSVVRLELAPTVSFERDGEPVPLGDPAGEDPAVTAARHLGLLGFLDDLRSGALLDPRRWPRGAHPGWGRTVERLLVAHTASLSRSGAAVPTT